MTILDTAEGNRLKAADFGSGWRRWGPYVSDRQWGTVREDYSPGGTAWEYFPHDHARSRAYRWGEDAIAGFSDDRQLWCLGVALWNGRDPILKERLFGLTNSQGNHGEDVKEVYAYTDATPTHSYMRVLYRYPQAEYPYQALIDENARRGTDVPEYELIDTGVFDEDRYFDVVVEYGKASPDDILMRITVTNRGPAEATLHVIPQLWARNTWSWKAGSRRPLLQADGAGVQAVHPRLRDMRLECDSGDPFVFCENETNVTRLYGVAAPGPFKDGIDDLVIHGNPQAVSAARRGTKCGAPTLMRLAPGETRGIRLRFRPVERQGNPFGYFDARMQARRDEADEFYAALQANVADPGHRLVQRQALAGMIWSKQLYLLDVRRWQDGDPAQPKPPPGRTRNHDWRHLNNADVISMPDKWEYPWYAAWDLAFHCIPLGAARLRTSPRTSSLLHPARVVHAPERPDPRLRVGLRRREPACLRLGRLARLQDRDRSGTGAGDHASSSKRVFHKLMLNFTWWVNRKDAEGRNVFQGGFLGLDNIGVFDRSAPLPTGGHHRAVGRHRAGWRCTASTCCTIALELALPASPSTRTWPPSSGSTSSTSPRPWPPSARTAPPPMTRACGTRDRRPLLRRPPHARRHRRCP